MIRDFATRRKAHSGVPYGRSAPGYGRAAPVKPGRAERTPARTRRRLATAGRAPRVGRRAARQTSRGGPQRRRPARSMSPDSRASARPCVSALSSARQILACSASSPGSERLASIARPAARPGSVWRQVKAIICAAGAARRRAAPARPGHRRGGERLLGCRGASVAAGPAASRAGRLIYRGRQGRGGSARPLGPPLEAHVGSPRALRGRGLAAAASGAFAAAGCVGRRGDAFAAGGPALAAADLGLAERRAGCRAPRRRRHALRRAPIGRPGCAFLAGWVDLAIAGFSSQPIGGRQPRPAACARAATAAGRARIRRRPASQVRQAAALSAALRNRSSRRLSGMTQTVKRFAGELAASA